jgi:hypothetical protein
MVYIVGSLQQAHRTQWATAKHASLPVYPHMISVEIKYSCDCCCRVCVFAQRGQLEYAAAVAGGMRGLHRVTL